MRAGDRNIVKVSCAIVKRLEEQVAVLLVNRASQPQDLRGRRTAPTARSLGELCIDSTSTTSLGNGDGDGYLRTDTGRRAILPHHPSDYASRPPPDRATVIRSDPARWREGGSQSSLGVSTRRCTGPVKKLKFFL
ncbi:hypothetical protein J6590_079056 [Homalodisca vitripennis]|nr:hypothetical protein J6590_079056 [Homalodisca vitripennis]